MKRSGLTVLVLALALVPALAYSQMNGATIKADVPFDFTAGNKTIPAGKCLVRVEGQTNSALWIGNPDAKVAAYILPLHTESLNPATRTVLVFHKYGDRYFLARVERDGSSSGFQMQMSKVEKELRAQNSRGEEIRLAAK